MFSLLKRSRLFAFNLLNRDEWVAQQAVGIPAGSRVLDIGAGSCPYRKLFSHCAYRAQDFHQLAGDQLRHGSYGQIDYVCDASAIPVEDASFDVVLCTEVMEHIAEPLKVVAEFARILKPGGRLLMTAPLGSGIHQEPHHYYGGFTPYWYHRFLAELGFDAISVEANAGSFAFFSQESLRFIKSTSPLRLDAPFLVRLSWAPFWVALLPFLAGVVPLGAHLLDRYDKQQRFTVGYHVSARRQ